MSRGREVSFNLGLRDEGTSVCHERSHRRCHRMLLIPLMTMRASRVSANSESQAKDKLKHERVNREFIRVLEYMWMENQGSSKVAYR